MRRGWCFFSLWHTNFSLLPQEHTRQQRAWEHVGAHVQRERWWWPLHEANISGCTAPPFLFHLNPDFAFKFRCVGKQAWPTGGVPHRSQSRILWAHPELSQTWTAHHKRWNQPARYKTHTHTCTQMPELVYFSGLCPFLTSVAPPAGVLEEARFFGIEQLAEQLETLIKVWEHKHPTFYVFGWNFFWVCHVMSVCVFVSSFMISLHSRLMTTHLWPVKSSSGFF